MPERKEYRVVGDPGSAAARLRVAGPFLSLTAAESARDEFNPVGSNVVWRNVHVQTRTVAVTPWVDLPESKQGGGE